MRHHYSESALLADFYEIAMLQAYFSRGMNETAVFEFFVRHLPDERNFLMAAGLEQVVAYLAGLRFDPNRPRVAARQQTVRAVVHRITEGLPGYRRC